jgi:hypothetical protein
MQSAIWSFYISEREKSVASRLCLRHTFRSRRPLHISALLAGIQARFGLAIDRESLVSSLSKRVARRDRFTRTARNTFALLP